MIIGFALGAVCGGVGLWFYSRLYYRSELQTRTAVLEAKLVAETRSASEKLVLLEQAQEKLTHTFKSLSADALQTNNQSFLQLAKTQLDQYQEQAKSELNKKQDSILELVKPVKDSLEKVDIKIQELEKSRARADESLFQQVRSLIDTQKELRLETSNLVTALRAPQGRGLWGEMQLKRVVEMAGMLEHCDFTKQESVTTEEGRLRPDLIVKLPGQKNIVVDAKTPLTAFLDALQETSIDGKREKMLEHSRHVRKHIEQLSRKSYWAQFQPAPEFVVLFLPGESFFSAALEQDPSLIELGVTQNVIIGTPTTLISLLRAVAYGWRQEKLAENAKYIGDLGRDLYKRIADMSGHITKLGKNLEQSVQAYNQAVGTLETRVLVSARRFQELDKSSAAAPLDAANPLDIAPRSLQAPELSPKN